MVSINPVQIIRDELDVIRKTPLTFALSLIVCVTVIGFVQYEWLFKEMLGRKDALIGLQEQEIKNLRASHPEATTLKPAPTIGTTGPATTLGDGSVANSGVVGSLTVGDHKKKSTDTQAK